MCKVSKGVIAYDTSFAKSKVPFARTIATFSGRSFKLSVVVLYKNAFMGFSGDAHIKDYTEVRLGITMLGIILGLYRVIKGYNIGFI